MAVTMERALVTRALNAAVAIFNTCSVTITPPKTATVVVTLTVQPPKISVLINIHSYSC